MRRMLFFLLFIVFFPMRILADASYVDNRYYVTDEMWAQEPYKKFVKFSSFDDEYTDTNGVRHVGDSCSAQYVAPNLILTAAHCVVEGEKYSRIENYEGKICTVKLLDLLFKENNDIGKQIVADYALYLVRNPKCYSDTYFNVSLPTGRLDVMSAGWGYLRKIEATEIDDIQKILSDLVDKHDGFVSLTDLIYEIDQNNIFKNSLVEEPTRLKASKCVLIADKDCISAESFDKLSEYENMKFDKNLSSKEREAAHGKYLDLTWELESKCGNTFLYSEKFFPDIMASSCVMYGGNSGGGVVSLDGEHLFGVASYGTVLPTLSNGFDSYYASSWGFNEKIRDFIQKYPPEPAEEEVTTFSVAAEAVPQQDEAEQVVEQEVKTLEVALPEETFDENTYVLSQEHDIVLDKRIDKLKEEKSNLETELTDKLPNIKNMEKSGFVAFLGKIANYQVNTKRIKRLEELKRKYEEAKEKEQSLANRTLTALSVAAAGIGGMELAMGLAEQKADKEADADMTAYIETMRCTYGDGKQVKAGPEGIELPGGNNETLMNLRNEYFALASNLKERKEALGMKPDIESEVIMDKSEMGLYDDENIGITDGAYASLYRAKALNSEADQAKIDEDKESSKKRVTAGGVLSGVGVVGSVVGDSMINGKLSEMIKTQE